MMTKIKIPHIPYNFKIYCMNTSCVPLQIHIIKRGLKWAVVSQSKKRAIKLFKFKDLAYHYAKTKFLYHKIVVHKSDGTIEFTS